MKQHFFELLNEARALKAKGINRSRRPFLLGMMAAQANEEHRREVKEVSQADLRCADAMKWCR